MSEAVPSEDLVDLYDNAPCGYLSLSPDGHIVKVNRTLADWLGRAEGELLSRSIHEVLSFGGKIAFETHVAPLLRLQGFVHEIALDLLDSRGGKIPVIANAAERRGPKGEHLFTRLTVFKAVDRRTFERSLIEARIKAEAKAKSERQATELREQFIAVLGHDLRNPLAAILAGIHVLRKGVRPGQRERAVLDEMEGSVRRANGLISNVMDFARGKLGEGLTLEFDPNRPLRPILEQVMSEVRAISPDRDFKARFEIDGPVDCDPDRIGQLAANLLSNAVSHGAPSQPVVMEARTTKDSFELSVANGGPAIPDSVREQLFQPFIRGGVSKNREGLGLGLFIVSEIAKAHNGRMEVSSDDEATRFTFIMPRRSGRP